MAVDLYATAKPLLGALPQWIADDAERRRVATYQLYENIYWTVPDTFKLTSRGAEDKPIYIPSAKQIVETLHRFLAPALNVVPDPLFGAPNDQLLATQVITDLMRRERLASSFSSNKRFGIIRGDWFFHLIADPAKEAGSRISIETADPGTIFPIYQPGNLNVVIGFDHVELLTIGDKSYVRRTRYLKQTMTGGPSPINVTDGVFEVDKWGGPGMDPKDEKPVTLPGFPLLAPQTLPSPIDSLPLYHISNFTEPGVFWGSSEIRGLERVMAAINQSVSDEELTLALEGLGVYYTDAGTPVNDDGEDVPWNLGPGRVVEMPEGKKLERATGATSVSPYQDHLKYLHEQLDQSEAISAIAKGRVDVSTAESGVALLLELGPLFAKIDEKEQVVTDVMTNMLFDLAKWYVAYEGTAFNSLLEVTRWIPKYGPRLPRNSAQDLKDTLAIAALQPPVVSATWVRDQLRSMGYNMPDEATITSQIQGDQQAAADITGSRIDQEVQGVLNAAAAPDSAGT